MNADLASLHKILKDETRRKILLLLNDKQGIAYTDLMDAVDVISTGTLNYHLKILGDLLTKNETGRYILSEKGKLAARLIIEFPEQDYSLQEKKLWWRRFWIVVVSINVAGLLFALVMYVLGYLEPITLARWVFGFIIAFVFIYFFYRMVRPTIKTGNLTKPQTGDQFRTVKDIFVSGRTTGEVNAQIQEWVKQEGIKIEAQREGFFRGRLGIPSGLGLTAPKYFEVSSVAKDNGVDVHTEGWISVYDIGEQSFSSNPWVMGSIPRRKGQKVIEQLWRKLEGLSR